MAVEWRELSWIIPRELTEILGAELSDLGALGIQEDYLPGEEPPPRQPWEENKVIPDPAKRCLKIWFSLDTDIEHALVLLKKKYPTSGAYTWSTIKEDDWEQDWKQHFSRFVVSEKLTVSPPWEAQEGDLVIEPGLAFGTGNHPTTHSCLEAIAQLAVAGESCLDLGCGTGILALAAAKLGMHSLGVDFDLDAIQASQKNAAYNNLHAEFRNTPIEEIRTPYPLVVANLYAEVLIGLSSSIIPLVGRHLALAGILSDRVHLVKKAYNSLTLIREKQEGEWVSLWYAV